MEEDIIKIFPELKESEDERIRKQIITYLSTVEDKELIPYESWIAWLEKQGDINRRIQEEIEKQTKQQWKSEKQCDNVNGECSDTALQEQLKIWFEKGRCSGIDDVIFHPQKYGLEKQGDQKLIDKIQLGKKYKCIASPRYSTFVKGFIYKPEDKFLCSLMSLCSNCFEPIEKGEHIPTCSGKMIHEFKAYMKGE